MITDKIYPLVKIPSGEVIIGSEEGDIDEKPVRKVNVDEFLVGIYPVTQELYSIVTGCNPSFHKGDKLPVECVSWYDAVEFANQLSLLEGIDPYYTIEKHCKNPESLNPNDKMKWNIIPNNNRGYRLLMENEWEYAAKGAIYGEAWSEKNSSGSTHIVGELKPNNFGLFDILGNVSEWCFDWYTDVLEPERYYKAHRGGSWYDDPFPVRITYRGAYNPYWKNHTIGFRVGKSI